MMNTEPNLSSTIHIYKYKPGMILLNLLVLVFFLGITAVPVGMIVAIELSPTSSGSRSFSYLYLCTLSPILALLGGLVLQQIISFIQLFFSYIKVTPDGIEHKMWPYRHIRARWTEIDRLDKFLLYDVLYLKTFEIIGVSLSFTTPLKVLNLFQTFIPLSQYQGYPQGQLAQDLKRHIPQVFENHSPGGAAQSAAPTGISPEDRLLAALSHAAVLFTGIGFFLPLIVYVSQRKKSAFLAVHALQALYYQLVGALFGFVFPFCLVGAMLLSIFSASTVGGRTSPELAMGAIMFLAVTVTVLMVLVGIAYTVYGCVGAVRAYQGKEFRYRLIGKFVKKDVPPA